jgi:hypothetical protein
MVLSHKGGSLCVKDAFAKKFLSGEIPLAACYSRCRDACDAICFGEGGGGGDGGGSHLRGPQLSHFL